MAEATTLKFSQFLILVGDGGSPENFVDPCGLTSRGFNRTAETNTTNVPDCADPDAASWVQRDVVSLSGEMSGAGVMADESFDVWNDWFESGLAKNVRIELGARAWEGRAILTALNIKGERGSRVQVDVTMQSDGEIIQVAS